MTADLETMQARTQWHNNFKVLKLNNCQPGILYPDKISFKIKGKIMFSYIQNIK